MRRKGLHHQVFETGGGGQVGQVDRRRADQLRWADEEQPVAHHGEVDPVECLPRERVEGRGGAQAQLGTDHPVVSGVHRQTQPLEKRTIHEREMTPFDV